MQRNILSLALAASMLGAAALAACSGGDSGSSTPGSSSALPNTPTSTNATGTTGLQLVLTINSKQLTQSTQRAASGSRNPQYVSSAAEGLQIAVNGGASAKTVYADIHDGSPLCTSVSVGRTCTIAVPTVGASETITATEVDQEPTGATAGYGTGFPSSSNILAAGTTTASPTPGTLTTVTLGLSPVWEQTLPLAFDDTTDFTPEHAGWDGTTNRATVTAGANSVYLAAFLEDADSQGYDIDSAPLPFVDVNASPEPISVTSNSSHVQFAALENPSYGTPTPTYGLSASAPNDNYLWFNVCVIFGMQTDSGFVPPSTASVTLSNNFKANSPFTASAFATPPPAVNLTVVPISVSPTTATVHVSSSNGPTTATVTGNDYGATSGMAADGNVVTPSGRHVTDVADPGECLDTSNPSTEDASVTSNGAISNSGGNWTQTFTITAITAGTCTFYLSDVQSWTVTQPVTVTVAP